MNKTLAAFVVLALAAPFAASATDLPQASGTPAPAAQERLATGKTAPAPTKAQAPVAAQLPVAAHPQATALPQAGAQAGATNEQARPGAMPAPTPATGKLVDKAPAVK